MTDVPLWAKLTAIVAMVGALAAVSQVAMRSPSESGQISQAEWMDFLRAGAPVLEKLTDKQIMDTARLACRHMDEGQTDTAVITAYSGIIGQAAAVSVVVHAKEHLCPWHNRGS